MTGNKTRATGASVDAFIEAVEPVRRCEEAKVLDDLFRQATGWTPRLWGPSIIGYGRYHYRYDSGREGDFPATGFSPRKARHSIYIMPGYADFPSLMARLGKHRTGKACLYVNTLKDIDLDVLADLVQMGLEKLRERYPVYSE